MAKKWLVYPFTQEDFEHGAAKQGLIQVIDPDNKDEVITLRVSYHDCDDLDDWIEARGYRSGLIYKVHNQVIDDPVRVGATSDPGVPFEWAFDDLVDVVFRRPLEPPENRTN